MQKDLLHFGFEQQEGTQNLPFDKLFSLFIYFNFFMILKYLFFVIYLFLNEQYVCYVKQQSYLNPISMQNEPKNIDDYKDVVKILKLKIIKQNKRIQELQLKNKTYEEQINSFTLRGSDLNISSRAMVQLQNEANSKKQQRQIEMSTLKGKVEVMNVYAVGLKKIGITPESVFRITDFAYKNYVQSDYFRQVLSKMKLGLSQKEISCLIFIFDQSYSGFITREDYYNSLQAYKIGVEDSCNQYIHQCVFKLSQMMHSDKINLIKFYEELENRSKSKVGLTSKKLVDLSVFEQQLKKGFNSRICDKEIVASFNGVDLESQGYLEKSNFLYTITSFINKLLTGEEGQSKKSQIQWGNAKSNLTQLGPSPRKGQKLQESFNQTSKLVPSGNETQLNSIDSCVSKLQKNLGIPLSRVYEEIVNFDFSHRLTLKAFRRLCLKINEKLNTQLSSQLYKQMDTQFKGSIYFNQLLNFYLSHSADCEMILRLLGKYLAVSDLDSQKFWFQFGLHPQSEISKTKFIQLMKKTFETKEEKGWENLWLMFDRGRGSCNIGTIIKYLQKYQS